MAPTMVDEAVDRTLVDLRAISTAVRLEIEGTGSSGAGQSRVARDWSRCLSSSVEGGPATTLRLAPDPDVSPVIQDYLLTTQVTAAAIEHAAGTHLMLHACGLSDDDGRVLALVAPSGTGKSTAALTLGRSMGYVTDEVVAIDGDGHVAPFPRPVAIEDAGTGTKRQSGPDRLGLLVCPDELRIGRLVLLDRRPAHEGPPTLTQVPLAEALLELIPQTSALGALDTPLQRLGRLVDRCGGVFRLTYREIADGEPALRELLTASSRAEASWSVPDDLPVDADAVVWALLDGRVRRAPVTDAVEIDGELLALVDGVPVRVSGIGRTVWDLAGSAPTLDELERRVVAIHGPHPEAAELVARAVGSMCQARILGLGRPRTVEELSTRPRPVTRRSNPSACCGAPDPRA